MQLITLSSPIAIRTQDGTRMVNAVEADDEHCNKTDMVSLRVHKFYDSTVQTMQAVNPVVRVLIKKTNVRSRQEVA